MPNAILGTTEGGRGFNHQITGTLGFEDIPGEMWFPHGVSPYESQLLVSGILKKYENPVGKSLDLFWVLITVILFSDMRFRKIQLL